MKFNNNYKRPIYVLCAVILAGCLTACSNDTPSNKESSATAEPQSKISKALSSIHNPFDHSHDEVVTDVVKHQFEHVFAEDCVNREIRLTDDKAGARERFEKPCMCIAQYLMKDLTADEAEKFLDEHKNAQSLRIKYDNAAFHCLQQQSLPKGPQFGRH